MVILLRSLLKRPRLGVYVPTPCMSSSSAPVADPLSVQLICVASSILVALALAHHYHMVHSSLDPGTVSPTLAHPCFAPRMLAHPLAHPPRCHISLLEAIAVYAHEVVSQSARHLQPVTIPALGQALEYRRARVG